MAGLSRTPGPTPAPPSLKKSASGSQSSKNQTSIAGFFQRKASAPAVNGTPPTNGSVLPVRNSPSHKTKRSTEGSNQSLTPAPSSDAVEQEERDAPRPVVAKGHTKGNGLPSPITPAGIVNGDSPVQGHTIPTGFYSPSRKVWESFLRWRCIADASNTGKEGGHLC